MHAVFLSFNYGFVSTADSSDLSSALPFLSISSLRQNKGRVKGEVLDEEAKRSWQNANVHEDENADSVEVDVLVGLGSADRDKKSLKKGVEARSKENQRTVRDNAVGSDGPPSA